MRGSSAWLRLSVWPGAAAVALAVVSGRLPPRPTLRARLEKKPSEGAVGAAEATWVDGGWRARRAVVRRARYSDRSRRVRRIDVSDRDRSGQAVDGTSDRPWPWPPSDSPVLPFGQRGGKHLVHAAVDAGIEPGDRCALGDQPRHFGVVLPAASGARRRRLHRGSHRPGIWPRLRTPDRVSHRAPSRRQTHIFSRRSRLSAPACVTSKWSLPSLIMRQNGMFGLLRCLAMFVAVIWNG